MGGSSPILRLFRLGEMFDKCLTNWSTYSINTFHTTDTASCHILRRNMTAVEVLLMPYNTPSSSLKVKFRVRSHHLTFVSLVIFCTNITCIQILAYEIFWVYSTCTVPVKSNLTFLSHFYRTSIPVCLLSGLEVGGFCAKWRMLLC